MGEDIAGDTVRIAWGDNVVELPRDEFLRRIGRAATGEVGATRYLLFARPDNWAAGGVGDLIGTFASEVPARDAFLQLRLAPDHRQGWAELVAVGPSGEPKLLCWFSRGSSPAHPPPPTPSPPAAGRRRRGWLSRRRRGDADGTPADAPRPLSRPGRAP